MIDARGSKEEVYQKVVKVIQTFNKNEHFFGRI